MRVTRAIQIASPVESRCTSRVDPILPFLQVTNSPKIQLLIFQGCPLASAARKSLQKALALAGLRDFEEIDILDAATPDDLKGWGSPTILVDGNDVAGSGKGEAIGCRVYDGPDRVPAPEDIATAIRSSIG
jgi:hypothetical protein